MKRKRVRRARKRKREKTVRCRINIGLRLQQTNKMVPGFKSFKCIVHKIDSRAVTAGLTERTSSRV